MSNNATHITHLSEEQLVGMVKRIITLTESEQRVDELSKGQLMGLGMAGLGLFSAGQAIRNNHLSDELSQAHRQEYVRQNDSIDNEYAKATYNASGSEFLNAHREMLRSNLEDVANANSVDPDVQNELFRSSKPICTAKDDSLKEMARMEKALSKLEPGRNCALIYLGDRFYLYNM